MRRAAVAAAVLVAVLAVLAPALGGAAAGGGGGAGPEAAAAASVRVPKVVGRGQRSAECLLRRRGLRWRYTGSSRVHSRPAVACDSGPVSHDPEIVRQCPRAGRLVRRGSVVVLRARR